MARRAPGVRSGAASYAGAALSATGRIRAPRSRRREFPAGRWALLQTLADVRGNRLVLTRGHQSSGAAANPRDGQETVEIAHEALLTRWPRLHAWLGEAPEDKRMLDRLADRAAEWADAPTREAKDQIGRASCRERV